MMRLRRQQRRYAMSLSNPPVVVALRERAEQWLLGPKDYIPTFLVRDLLAHLDALTAALAQWQSIDHTPCVYRPLVAKTAEQRNAALDRAEVAEASLRAVTAERTCPWCGDLLLH